MPSVDMSEGEFRELFMLTGVGSPLDSTAI
jgi:hypothetical protein